MGFARNLKRFLSILVGVALILAGLLGLVLSVGGLLVLPRLERQAEEVAAEQIEVFDRALAVTLDGLITAETSVVQAAEAVDALEGIMADVGEAIDDTTPTIEVAADLLSEQLPSTIETTQDALASVATSARLVDDILGVISGIPLLGAERYSPDVPLHQGFQAVSDSMDGIPELLLIAGQGLDAGTGSLQDIEEGFAAMGRSIGETTTSLESAQTVLEDYQQIVGELQGAVSYVSESLPGWLRATRWGLTLTLIWLGIAQLGLITQGWERLGRRSIPMKVE